MRSLPYPFISYLMEMWAVNRQGPALPSSSAQPIAAAAAPPPPPPPTPTPTPTSTAFRPRVKSVTPIGIATDTLLNRDSCVSARLGNRTLWTCRDTQWVMPNGLPQLRLFSSTASWSDGSDADGLCGDGDGLPRGELRMYGDQDGRSFFPLLEDECNSNEAGLCGDDTRFSIWPDSSPLVAQDAAPDGTVSAYTWVKRFRINAASLRVVVPDPGTTLYRIDHNPTNGSAPQKQLPAVQTVDAVFWPEKEVPYGNYGTVVRHGLAYLYGQLSDGRIALARTRATRAAIENRGRYEYFSMGRWTADKPSADDVERGCCDVAKASAGGQGTYFYSERWGRYVWIGQAAFSVAADFYITTSPAPEGPWEQPEMFYRGAGGNYSLSAYSLQAHPALVEGCGNTSATVLSWTKNDLVPVGPGLNVYTTPLVKVVWV